MVIVTICACGCGELTKLARQSNRRLNQVKGHPMRYVWGHAGGAPPKTRPDGVPTPCECGCGQLAPLAQLTNPKVGSIKGQPLRYVHGHRHKSKLSEEERRERTRANERVWRQANPERARAQERRRSPKEREYRRARALERYQKLREEDVEALRLKGRAAAARRRARMAAAGVVENFTHAEVWERDGGICGICGTPADSTDWHMDHIYPISRGGPHTLANVQVSHPHCNWEKCASIPLDVAPETTRGPA